MEKKMAELLDNYSAELKGKMLVVMLVVVMDLQKAVMLVEK